MSNNSLTSSQQHNNSKPQQRLQQVNAHMGSVGVQENGSAFTSDVCPQAAEDPMFGLMAAYRKDTDPNKVDLGIGAYRDDNAKPWVLPVVKQVSYTHLTCNGKH
jgi:aspartate aminotransferase, cytoplasmic